MRSKKQSVGGLGSLLNETLHLVEKGEFVLQGAPVGKELHIIDTTSPQGTKRCPPDHITDLAESEFVFYVLRIDHYSSSWPTP